MTTNFIIINVISFSLMGIDKLQAIRKKQRISEFSLLTISLLGGSIGSLLGMIIFKHKIRKIKFLILVPLFLIINLLIYKIH